MEEQGFSESQIGMFTFWLSIVVDGLLLVVPFVQTICFLPSKHVRILVCVVYVWTSVCFLVLLWYFFCYLILVTMMSKMTYTFVEDLHCHTGPLIKCVALTDQYSMPLFVSFD